MMWLLLSLLAYALGSLPAGILYSRWRGEDIRSADLPGAAAAGGSMVRRWVSESQ
ncbi:hypothetical protein [Deinococcus radiophilus]|uniref:hypothetical protein n=1 Tax=Deinococcus radiophilus TaxID=32062 RepID=UPI00361FA295